MPVIAQTQSVGLEAKELTDMSDSLEAPKDYIVDAVTKIVVAYVADSDIGPAELVSLVKSLVGIFEGPTASAPDTQLSMVEESLLAPNELNSEEESVFEDLSFLQRKPKPAVDPRISVQETSITCLECGQSFRALKKHLGVAHKLTTDEYLTKWQLRADYPMVAPAFSAQRSKTLTRAHHIPNYLRSSRRQQS